MSVSFTFPGLHCPRVNRYVLLDQSEHDCRIKHKCLEAGRCPLEEELGRDPMERTLAALEKDEGKR